MRETKQQHQRLLCVDDTSVILGLSNSPSDGGASCASPAGAARGGARTGSGSILDFSGTIAGGSAGAAELLPQR